MLKVVKGIAKNIIILKTKLWIKVFSLYNKNPEHHVLEAICKSVENKKHKVSFRIKPQDSLELYRFCYTPCISHIVAIVIQGPILSKNEYTINTVKYYKQQYPDLLVIVSTWDDEDECILEEIKRCGGIVVTSVKPNYSGVRNINYQIVSSYAGIRKAQEMGAEYVCKTRTDQRIYKAHSFEFLLNLLLKFPSEDLKKQSTRVVVLGMNYGTLFFPYFMSDFFYFSSTKEMINLFNLPLDNRDNFIMPKNTSRRDCSREMEAPEIYILKKYYEYLGCRCDNTVYDYWDGLKKYFICVDRKVLDIDWPKYDEHFCENRYYGDYFAEDSKEKLMTENFDFVNWFNLYSGSLEYKAEYEIYADIVFR